ncbi:MAG: hypothetical protein NZ743_05325, partial [Pseudomonadales bacterium]|nr:hypothetical protein [Pseudomonadales bacterium]
MRVAIPNLSQLGRFVSFHDDRVTAANLSGHIYNADHPTLSFCLNQNPSARRRLARDCGTTADYLVGHVCKR